MLGTLGEIVLLTSYSSFQVKVILKLHVTSSGVRYYMHYDIYHELLYISLPNEKIVVKIQTNVRKNAMPDLPMETVDQGSYTIVAGVIGEACIGNKICGDGGLATRAMLAYPKVIKSIPIKFYFCILKT